MPSTRQKIAIIYNPTAGKQKARLFSDIIARLKTQDIELDLYQTCYAGHAIKIARDLKNAPYDKICAAGGDGTINEVLNGLYPSSLPLGVIPIGTANVLAKVLYPDETPKTITNVLVNGTEKNCYLGKSDKQYFSLMVSMGPDAEAVATVNPLVKKYLGKTAYALSFIKQIICYRHVTYDVDIDGTSHKAAAVIISKAQYYGGKYICAADADIGEKIFHISLFTKKGRWQALIYALKMISNKIPCDHSVEVITGNKIRIHSSQSASYQIDGDTGRKLPVSLSLLDQPITLLTGKS